MAGGHGASCGRHAAAGSRSRLSGVWRRVSRGERRGNLRRTVRHAIRCVIDGIGYHEHGAGCTRRRPTGRAARCAGRTHAGVARRTVRRGGRCVCRTHRRAGGGREHHDNRRKHLHGAGCLRVADWYRLPLGLGTLAAAAFDPAMFPATLQAMRPPSLAAGIIRAVRMGGRLVTPATSALPPDTITAVRTVARDDTEWVGEVTVATSGLVTLRRQPPET